MTRKALNVRTLLVLTMCLTTVAVAFQEVLVQLVLVALALALYPLSGGRRALPRLARRARGLLWLVFTLFVFQTLFRHSGETLWAWGVVRVTSGGVLASAAVSLRMVLVLLLAGVLFGVPYSEFLLAFRAWRIPYEIAFVVTSTIHFLPQFDHRFRLTKEALLQRGVRLDKLPLAQRPRTYTALLTPVLGQALHDVRQRAAALELRAFRLHPTRTWRGGRRLHAVDWALQSVAVLGALAYIALRVW